MRNPIFKRATLVALGLVALAAFTWAGSPVGFSTTGQRDARIVSIASAEEAAATPAEPEAVATEAEPAAAEPEAVAAEPAPGAAESTAADAAAEAAATEPPPVPTPPPGLEMPVDDAAAEAEQQALISDFEMRGREAGRRHKRAVLAALGGAWAGMQSSWAAVSEATGGAWDVTRETSVDAWDVTRETSVDAWDVTRDVSANAWNATWDVSVDAWRYTRQSIENTWPDF